MIEGFSHATVLTLMSELGEHGIRKFHSEQYFSSWLRLAPNNKISGGRVISSKTPKGSNRLKTALRQAANAIANLNNTHTYQTFLIELHLEKVEHSQYLQQLEN